MKRAIIIILAFYFNPLSCIGQTYLNSDLKWHEAYASYGTSVHAIFRDYTIYLSGDTIIENKTYWKSYEEGIETRINWVVDTLIYIKDYKRIRFPIREENGSFFIYDYYRSEDALLQNFNLTVGDTVQTYCATPQIVEKIDSINIGNIKRKRFHYFNNNYLYSYEGIGTGRGLFSRPCSSITIESGSYLRCFQIDDINHISFDSTYHCLQSTHTKEEQNEKIKIFPNPSSGYIYFDGKNFSSKNYLIRLYTLQGTLILQIYKQLNQNSNVIDINRINFGVYLLVIQDQNSYQTFKIIKI